MKSQRTSPVLGSFVLRVHHKWATRMKSPKNQRNCRYLVFGQNLEYFLPSLNFRPDEQTWSWRSESKYHKKEGQITWPFYISNLKITRNRVTYLVSRQCPLWTVYGDAYGGRVYWRARYTWVHSDPVAIVNTTATPLNLDSWNNVWSVFTIIRASRSTSPCSPTPTGPVQEGSAL